MPAYRYDALDAAGKNVNGLIEADNAKAARASLRSRGLVPMDVQTVAAAAADGSYTVNVNTADLMADADTRIEGKVTGT